MQNKRTADCLVVGAGPAGLTAAIYLRRFQRKVVVVDHGHSRALSIERSHNYPGFPKGISGHDLLQLLGEQLTDLQGEVVRSEVTTLRRAPQGGFEAQCGDDAWLLRTVLLATGVEDVVPALAGIEQAQKLGLLRQCPVCDGYEHRGQRIVVFGDGSHASREAAFLSHYSSQVVHAGLTNVPSTAQPGVHVLPALAIKVDVTAEGGVRVFLSDGQTHQFDVAYAAISALPRSQLGCGLGAAVDEKGNLVIDAEAATNVPGLFAAGDVACGLDQLVVAAAQGASAATAIHNMLRTTSA